MDRTRLTEKVKYRASVLITLAIISGVIEVGAGVMVLAIDTLLGVVTISIGVLATLLSLLVPLSLKDLAEAVEQTPAPTAPVQQVAVDAQPQQPSTPTETEPTTQSAPTPAPAPAPAVAPVILVQPPVYKACVLSTFRAQPTEPQSQQVATMLNWVQTVLHDIRPDKRKVLPSYPHAFVQVLNGVLVDGIKIDEPLLNGPRYATYNKLMAAYKADYGTAPTNQINLALRLIAYELGK